MVVPISAPRAVVGPLWWALREDIQLAGTARAAATNTDFVPLQIEDQLDAVVSLVENNLPNCSPLEH
jgi:hypothetical protein